MADTRLRLAPEVREVAVIYSLAPGCTFCFIHIPRTGGTSLTEGLATNHAAVVDVHEGKHRTAFVARTMLGEAWERAYRFSLIRSPWDIIASDYRHCMREAWSITAALRMTWTPEWHSRLLRIRAYDGFADFVLGEWLCDGSPIVAAGGFWDAFCGTGDVTPIRFEALRDQWPTIAAKCGCPCAELPHVNGTWAGIEWPAWLAESVGAVCAGDVAIFGFEPPVL